MCISYLFVLAILCGRSSSSGTYDGWSYLNLHCRDNDNKPVDWWYIYKPPGLLPSQSGYNFSYITPSTAGRWRKSEVPIDKSSMLVNTMLPMYKRSFKEHLALAIYQNRNAETAARGILMADQVGGILLTHTVPGFPNIHLNQPDFPREEAPIGHLLVCVSLEIEAINEAANVIGKISPKFVYVNIPPSLQDLLPAWDFESTSYGGMSMLPNVVFGTRDNTTVSLIARRPGIKTCLYRAFAEEQQINLNVYGQSRKEFLTTVCSQDFGHNICLERDLSLVTTPKIQSWKPNRVPEWSLFTVNFSTISLAGVGNGNMTFATRLFHPGSVRNIDMISLKYSEEVHYIVNTTDRTWFAVSTAASWQQKGAGPIQYWTCTSSVDKEDSTGIGALLLCFENYGIWRTFDNMKVKEPEC